MLRVLTWLWEQPKGRTQYTPDHVLIWRDMVRRHLTLPHEIAVVTDVEADYGDMLVIPPPRDFEDVRIPRWNEMLPQCYRRLAMFRPDAGAIFGNRFVSMDLDCVIGDSLDPLFARPCDFMMYRGTSETRPYNGSMLMMAAGARPQVYADFSPEGATKARELYIGSDQAWIAYRLGAGERTWSTEDGVYFHGNRHLADGDCRIVFFPGRSKPWERLDDPWIAEHYHRDRRGRCLVLGYGPTVWEEASAAMRGGTFDAVIASPEAAEHWPTVTHVARSDYEAETIAQLQGYAEVVFCGRAEGRAA